MMHRAWSSIVEVPYFLSRSYVQFQGHPALKIVEFDPNWAFPDSNASLNSLMAMKCCTKLETAKERCPIVFQGHPSNFKVTRDKTSPILTQIGRFRTIGRSQLSNPSDLPCFSLEAYGNRMEWEWPKNKNSFMVQNKRVWFDGLMENNDIDKHNWKKIIMAKWCHISSQFLVILPKNCLLPGHYFIQSWLIFTRGQFWPSGIVVGCVCLSVRLCVR